MATLIAPATAAQAQDVAPDWGFPASYAESRAQFRADCRLWLAREAGACASYPIGYPRVPDADLAIDTAYFSRHNPRLVILQSGLHGVEAFAGAAVLRMTFQRQLADLLRHGFDVLLIHAANPYGFAHLRRVDGNNVDLNRNFPPAAGGNLYRRINPAYRALRDIAEPHRPVLGVGTESTNLAVRTLFAYVAHRFSFAFVSNGTHAGQHEYPQGLEFGGFEPAQQTRFLRDKVAPIIAGHPGDVLFLDLHTGLGPANILTVYTGLDWPEQRVHAMRRFVEGIGHPRIRLETPAGSAYQTSGDVIDFVPGLAPHRPVTAVTLEWGTLGEGVVDELATNARMILENQAHFHGCVTDAVCAEVRRNFAALFNPEDEGFRRAVVDEAAAFLHRVARLRPGEIDGTGP